VFVDEVKNSLTGPVASVSTPFCKDGNIDYKGLENCIDVWIEGGSKTVLLTYGDSLFSILTDEEIAVITKRVVEYTNKRAMVVGAAFWWTGKTLDFAEYCKRIGVDILMVLPPNWALPTPEDLAEHYRKISEIIPVMMVTSLGGRPLPLETMEILLEGKNRIVALKDDICGDYARRAAKLIDGRWAFFSGGWKKNHLDVMPYGDISGYLSVYARFKPVIARKYWDAIKAGNIGEASGIIKKYEFPLYYEMRSLFSGQMDAVVHASMEIFGLCKRWRRSPYYDLSDSQMDELKAFYADLKLI